MLITKADGTQEEFRAVKLRSSLRKAGASKEEIESIVNTIESSLEPGISTQAIYKRAFELLARSEKPVAAKYSLRRAVFGLGPTGFPFEDFLARLFESDGYRTRRRVLVKGNCATHEIDVAAFKDDHSFVAEAKFHMRPGIKSDLQVAMYSYARFLDIKNLPVCKDDYCGIDDLYVITNTKFTHAAVKYAACTGIKLLSWDYPRGKGLQERIEQSGLYPVTVLTSLSTKDKRQLLESGTLLCSELLRRPEILQLMSLSGGKRAAILKEAGLLCGS